MNEHVALKTEHVVRLSSLMNYLITGGYGFIGSNYINHLARLGKASIVNIDCLNYCADISNVVPFENHVFIHKRLQDFSTKELVDILETFKITHVVHFAAQSHVDTSFVDTGLFVQDNILATHALLEACVLYNALEKFIYISTDEVYGDTTLDKDDTCKTEKSAFYPTNPYAATKAAAEMLAKSYYYSFKLPVIITRSNNVYGENQYHEKLVPKFIKAILNGERCTIHGDGQYKRTWVHACDFALAIDCVIEKGDIGEVYNIGTHDEFSVLEIAQMILECTGNIGTEHLYVKDRVFNDKRYHISFDKLERLGWKQTIPFKQGLQQLVDVMGTRHLKKK
jgi:dTDP-glucose 4,6-dehydratase